MPFVTKQTKCLSFLWKHHRGKCPGKDTKGGWDFTHHQSTASGFCFVFLFSLQRDLFHNIFFLMRSLPVITHTVEIFPSLIYCYHPQFWCFVILSYFLIRPVSYIRSSLIMIPDCPVNQIWWKKNGRIMWERSEISQHTYCESRWCAVFRDGRQVSYQKKRRNIWIAPGCWLVANMDHTVHLHHTQPLLACKDGWFCSTSTTHIM